MPGKDVLQPFLEEHVHARAQATHELQRWRVGKASSGVGGSHGAEIEVSSGTGRRPGNLEALRTDADDRHAGGQHEPLLRARNRHVHAPLLHAEVHRGQRRDAVRKQHRRVIAGIHRAAHRRHIGPDAGRGLVVGHQDGLELVTPVCFQQRTKSICRRTRAPFALDRFDIQAVAAAQIDPAPGKHAVASGQDLVAGRQRVGDRRLPAAGAGGRKHEDLSGRRLEHLLEVGQQRRKQLAEVGRAMIHGLDAHRMAQAIRNIGRSGYEDRILTGHRTSPTSSMPGK